MLKKVFPLIVLSAILMSACSTVLGTPEPAVIANAKVAATGTQSFRQTETAENNNAATATAIMNALDAKKDSPSNATPMPSATAGSTTTTGYCPTRREVNDQLFGKNQDGSSKDIVVQVSTEGGAWQVNTGQPTNYFSATLPTGKGLVATIHRVGSSKAEVYIADSKKYDLFRGTFRFSGCYAATDDMNQPNNAVRILVKENFNGTYQVWLNQKRIQDWTFAVLAGNFSCPTDVCPSLAPAATFAPAAPAANATVTCPTFGGVQTTAGNDGSSYCKYKGSVVTDLVPAGWKADYWNGSVKDAVSGEKITTGDATFRRP